MKSIAALLLTIALALFPLSGTRAVAAVQAAGHAHGLSEGHSRHAVEDDHRHGAKADPAGSAAVHSHAGVGGHGQADSAQGSCAGDHATSSCCSLSCHAMAPHVAVVVPTLRQVTVPVGIAALPLPRGVGFDGLLRPPRAA